MDNLDFSEEEIQQQLAVLGYKNIPKHRLLEFKQDLDELIRHGDWKSLASPNQIDTKSPMPSSQPSPPAYVKEKVSQWNFEGSGERIFLRARKADHNRQVLTTCENRDYGQEQGRQDSYAQHSIAPKLQLPPGAPVRLQAEPHLEDSLRAPLSDSFTSSPDIQERRFIKRKVLRKYQGQSLVCDESVYSDDSGGQLGTMYKMYNTQWDDESNDDKNSLSSSFWSDGEKQEEDEEEEIEGVLDYKPVDNAEDTSEEEKPELNNPRLFTRESSKEGSEEEDEDEVDEADESCNSSSDSRAPSLMTSGYGTYRPEEQEGGDYRDDNTITEFDQDSQGDLSEMRDDEEDNRSLGGYCQFDIVPTHEPDFNETTGCLLADRKLVANVACCGDDGPNEERDVTDVKGEDEEKSEEELHKNTETNATSEKQVPIETKDRLLLDEKHSEDGSDLKEGEKQEEVLDLQEVNNVETEVEDKVASEDPDESSSHKDIKFIDSRVDMSRMTYDKMCAEWEGNLRQKTDATSCLEEQLADLHLSTSAPQDFESQNEAGTDQSSITDGISLGAFESYVRGMTRAPSDFDLRPKPKSFIRPVISQQTIKKSDPVTKYFQYKQLWEMFKLPGEKDRRAVRWEIKERLAYQPPPPKPRKVYVPNTYIVPTEKKRLALRWEIRNDLANGFLPHKFNCQF